MKVKVKIEGKILGLETAKYGEKVSHKLKLIQGMELIGISVSAEKFSEVRSIPQYTEVIVLVEIFDIKGNSGFYMRFIDVIK